MVYFAGSKVLNKTKSTPEFNWELLLYKLNFRLRVNITKDIGRELSQFGQISIFTPP